MTQAEVEELEFFLDCSHVPREHEGQPLRLVQRGCAGYIGRTDEDAARIREGMLRATSPR